MKQSIFINQYFDASVSDKLITWSEDISISFNAKKVCVKNSVCNYLPTVGDVFQLRSSLSCDTKNNTLSQFDTGFLKGPEINITNNFHAGRVNFTINNYDGSIHSIANGAGHYMRIGFTLEFSDE